MSNIKVTKIKANFRPNSARAAYYEAITAFNGKSVESFAASVAKTPPSYPKRGKLKGKAEPIQGWISYFVREGLVEIK